MSGVEAWVTLATNDSYAMGALVLAKSLRRVNTSKQIAVMITPGLSGAMRDALSDIFDVVTEVNILDSEDAAHLALLERPELGITFTKIHCWKLTQFSKCVFLDADTLVIQNSDELFEREELSAAPDVGWPDCFNSGVYVFTPSLETYDHIHKFALSNGSFDGGDQGLLNMYFSGWSQADASRRLPFVYNMVASASYSYLPAFKVFGANVKIVHFIGQEKPWLIFFDTSTGVVRPPGGQEHLQELLQAWWNIFRSEVHPRLSPEMGDGHNQSATMVEQKGIAGIYAKMSLDGGKSVEQIEYEDHMRKMAWEQGHIDYMGKDSFDNIMKRIQASMAQTSVQKPVPQRKQTPPKQEAPQPPPTATSEQPPPKQEAPSQPPPTAAPEQIPPKVEATPPPTAAPEQTIPKKQAPPPPQKPPTAAPEQTIPKKQATPPPQKPPTAAPEQTITKKQATPPIQKQATPPPQKQATPPPQKPPTAAPEQTIPKKQATPPPQKQATPPPQKQAIPPPQKQATPPPQKQATSAAPPKSKGKTPTQPPPKQQVDISTTQVPVVEPIIRAVTAQTQAAPPSAEDQAAQEDERKAQEERQALEKKLAEQKRSAEQKLEAEKQAAAARAAAATAASAPKAAKQEPKAPPRKVKKESQSPPGQTVGNAMPYGALGILGAAVVVVFAIYAAYSPASFVL